MVTSAALAGVLSPASIPAATTASADTDEASRLPTTPLAVDANDRLRPPRFRLTPRVSILNLFTLLRQEAVVCTGRNASQIRFPASGVRLGLSDALDIQRRRGSGPTWRG